MNLTFSGEDVDIFVFTYNRADLLERTLQNLLCQTEPGIRIYVLDNASTDNTKEVVQKFQSRGVLYLRGEINSGWHGNFERAKLLANRSWTLLFHDDDLLHPRFCEWALKQINSNDRICLLASAVSFDECPDDLWPGMGLRDDGNPTLCNSVKDFASMLYSGFPLSFASALYSTKSLFSYKWIGAEYGKIADRPFLINFVEGRGKAIVFKCPLVKYRIHSNQDSQHPETGPYVEQLSLLHNLYFKYLGCNPFRASGRSFLFNNYKLLKDEYLRLAAVDRYRFSSFGDYWMYIYDREGSTMSSKYIGRLLSFITPFRILGKMRTTVKTLKKIIPTALIKRVVEIRDKKYLPKKIIEHMEFDFALSRLYNQRNIKVLDIGSHHGEFVDILGSFNHFHEWEIFCVEPLKENRKKIQKKKNKYKNVSVNILPVGVSDVSEIKKFYLGDADTLFTCNESWRAEFKELFERSVEHTIQCLTVDDLVEVYNLPKSDFDFIKIDVEGHDLNVIKSFCQSKIDSKVLMFEVSSDVTSIEEAINLLRQKGFREFILFGRTGIPTTFLGEYEGLEQLNALFSSQRISCGNMVCFHG